MSVKLETMADNQICICVLGVEIRKSYERHESKFAILLYKFLS